uniref:Uncharacterized protein n=1 Tax=Solanum lycopersicum TaxID=4081 RepID=A0A3Q7I065_SOLLC
GSTKMTSNQLSKEIDFCPHQKLKQNPTDTKSTVT